jgi:hypothetical protein
LPKVQHHFDAEGLVRAVHQQDIGLRCTTNNPRLWKAAIYKAARLLGLPVHIYSYPKRPQAFALMKRRAPFEGPANAQS